MEIKIGLAKTAKYANEYCGDSCDLAERPHGGISAIIADGQGNGLAALNTQNIKDGLADACRMNITNTDDVNTLFAKKNLCNAGTHCAKAPKSYLYVFHC